MFLDILFLLDICSFCSPWWLLPLLALAWLLGWLFWNLFRGSRYLTEIEDLKKEGGRFRARITDLEKELSNSKYEYDKLDKEYRTVRGKMGDVELKLRACEEQKASLAAAENTDHSTGTILGTGLGIANMNVKTSGGGSMGIAGAFKSDNLQIIEGVGPKIEGLLKGAGFTTWEAVANAQTGALQKVLDKAGSRYKIHNPKTWAEQAGLAANGDWDKLVEYQKFLDTGRDDTTDGDTPSKVEKLYAKILGFSAFKKNDLKIVEGIGPKIAQLLHDGGIKTWSALASSSVDKIQAILTAAGDRYRLANPKTWPRQAELADAGQWDELKEYQDFLDGGRD